MSNDIKLGYGTYGMRDENVLTALPRLRAMGYEFIEFCISEGWPTHPSALDADARKQIKDALEANGFPPAAWMTGLPFAKLPGQDAAADALCDDAIALAAELNTSDAPAIITSGLAGNADTWEADRDRVAAAVVAWGDRAADSNIVLAIEPHYGFPVDTPEKAVWLMEATQHANVKLNFDISHFSIVGLGIEYCVSLFEKDTVHIHVKDGDLPDGNLKFMLPGEGDFDYVTFMRSIIAHKLHHIPITVEVSGMVWTREDYDPWAAAQFCFDTLDSARRRI